MAYINPQAQIDQQQNERSDRNQAAIGNGLINGLNFVEENRRRAVDDKRKIDQISLDLAGKGASSAEIADYHATGNLNPIIDRASKLAEASRIKAISDAELNSEFMRSKIAANKAKAAKDSMTGGGKLSDAGKIDHKLEKETEIKGSPGDQALDKDYAKQYNTFSTKGVVNSAHTIKKLESLAGEMEGDTGFGEAGGTTLPLPDLLRSSTAIRRRDDTRSAANSTLKELFGGQLSDGERIAASNEYYNDKLSNAENAKILRTKIAQLKAAREGEIAKAKHFEKHRTLRGFQMNENPAVGSDNSRLGNGAGSKPWEKYQ